MQSLAILFADGVTGRTILRASQRGFRINMSQDCPGGLGEGGVEGYYVKADAAVEGIA